MAELKSTDVIGNLKVDNIKGNTTDGIIDIQNLSTDARYLRKVLVQRDVSSYNNNDNNVWVLGPILPNITGFKSGSLIQMTYYVPFRSYSDIWGGAYIEPQIRYNTGTWQSLGSCGYDGGVMIRSGQVINTYTNIILINPQQTSDFSAQFQFYFKPYSGGGTNLTINSNNHINTISDTTDLESTISNHRQHFFHIIVEEFALWA